MKYTIRRCQSFEELRSCVALQREIWGCAESDAYPFRLLLNVSRTGGHALGAFGSGGEMVGFVISLPAWRGRQRFFHSLVLGVLPGHENQGLGRALKLAQRRIALREGVQWIEWTFDPLRSKNAFFNTVRLGAIARRYVPDYYGPIESRLQLGLPSDRLIAEWWLRSPRVKRVVGGKPPQPPDKAAAARVAIPLDLDALVRTDARRAHEWQSRVREDLQSHFRHKLVITGFNRSETEAHFLLDRI